MSTRQIGWAIPVAATACVVAVGEVVVAATGPDAAHRLVHEHVLAASLAAVSFAVLGAVVVRRLPANRLGRLCLAIGVAEALSGLITEYARWALITHPGSLPVGAVVASLDPWLFIFPFAAIVTLLVAWFPDGRLHRRFMCVPLVVVAVGVAAFAVATAVMSWRLRGPGLLDGDTVDDGSWLTVAVDVGLVLFLVGAAGCVLGAGHRLRLATGRERAQLLWFLTGAALCVAALALAPPSSPAAPVLELVALPLVPAGIAVALFRHRLLDIELVINRAVLYGSLTVVIGAGYAGVVAAATHSLDLGSLPAAVVAAGLVAVVFDRVRRGAQRLADRLVYARRHDPAGAMSEVSRRLAAATGPELLDAVAAAVVAVLGARGARVVLAAGDGPSLVGTAGTCERPDLELPLATEDGQVGVLAVQAHPGAPWDAADRRLLDQLAVQVTVAARAVLLTVELRRSRARLAEVVESERRRLRRDLHDGLGTALVGIVMQLEALGNLVDRQTPAGVLAGTIETEARALVAETRRLVAGLVPPVVEELGLVEAVRQHADRLNRTGGRRGTFAVDLQGDARRVSVAVEVAAYVVATEAMTNAARHARASRCNVLICHDDGLRVEVVDDGIGVPAGRAPGVGLRSMRERAEDAGGEFSVTAAQPTGTRVLASFPGSLT